MGRERLAQLQEQVRSGEVDTLMVAFTDMQGRLMGKRVNGPRLPRRRHRPRRPRLHLSAGHGHGDEHARRLRAHELGDRLRRLHRRRPTGTRCACCRGRTAPRWCWATSSTRRRTREVPVSPRTILKRQVAAAADAGHAHQGGLRVRVLPAHRHLRGGRPQGLHRTSSASATTTRTTTCSRPPRPSPSTASCDG